MKNSIPSHRNSNNERRARRANWKQAMNPKTVKTESDLERMNRIAQAYLAVGGVSLSNGVFSITLGGEDSRVFEVKTGAQGSLECGCFDGRYFQSCAHIIAAQKFAARMVEEAEREAALDVPEKGYVNVTRAKVIQAVSRVGEYGCQVRKVETGKYEVHSFSSGNNYIVELCRGLFGVTAHCDCPDFTFHRLEKNEVCKHVASVYQFERQDRAIYLAAA